MKLKKFCFTRVFLKQTRFFTIEIYIVYLLKDTPDMPFIETDFRKRKAHLNYKMHYDVENEVIGIARKYKKQIG